MRGHICATFVLKEFIDQKEAEIFCWECRKNYNDRWNIGRCPYETGDVAFYINKLENSYYLPDF